MISTFKKTQKLIQKSIKYSSNIETPKEPGFFKKLFSKEKNFAKPEFKNRWLMVLPAFCTHLCIGSPWAWSTMIGKVGQEYGFVVASAADWSMSQVAFPMSIVFALQGISAALAGKWQMRVGMRAAMATAGLCFGGGLILGSIGIFTHQLWLLYLGYGFFAGCGVGIAYTPPVQALIEWFPDKKGLASGLTIAGFGSGALLFTPLQNFISQKFARLPEYLGKDPAGVELINGRFMLGDKELVYANAADLSKLSWDTLQEGFYVVGSGNTGSAHALAILGLGYLAVMLTSAFTMKKPTQGYAPAGWTPPALGKGNVGTVNVDTVMKTPQFYALSSLFFFIACGGMGLFSVAKPMMSEIFSGLLPLVVTAGFSSSFVMALAAGNLGGRIGWSIFSDYFGRRLTFWIFTISSIPLYLLIPYCVDLVAGGHGVLPLYMFIASSVVAITCMGGTYALLPAYEADLFGPKYVGPIHGRVLLASTAASIVGPSVLLQLRSQSEQNAINDLLSKVDPEKFKELFGVSIDNASELIKTKTLTLSKLMEIVPEGVQDPTPFLYHSTMYTMAFFMAAAAASLYVVKPVNPKYFEVIETKATQLTEKPIIVEETKKEETQ